MAAPANDIRRPLLGSSQSQSHPVTFTGTGSEYFRIWIVNLLLTFVTFGIYFPWAKVRKLRYFYGNTQVAGHALDFHGEPRKMLRGYGIVSALFAAYSLAGQFSPTAGGIALLVLMAVWPALLFAGQRFRLSQTSWRGLRFSFQGSMGGAYKALWPVLLPMAALAIVAFSMPDLPAPTPGKPRDPVPKAVIFAPTAVGLVTLLAMPLVWWTLKRWQHGGYALGSARAAFTARVGSFYGVFVKSLLLTLATAALVGIAMSMLTGAGALLALVGGAGQGKFAPWMIWAFVIVATLGYLAVMWVARPYFASRMQNLVWRRTESIPVGFESNLRYRPLLLLGLKNWLLMIVTLGLYWPFAAIAIAKMKLEAITVLAHEDLDALVRGGGALSKDAAGDAAGDVFGIDIGM